MAAEQPREGIGAVRELGERAPRPPAGRWAGCARGQPVQELAGPKPAASRRAEAAYRARWAERQAESAIFLLYHARAAGSGRLAAAPAAPLGPAPTPAGGGRDRFARGPRRGRGSRRRPQSPRGRPNPGAARARREPHGEARAAAASPGEPSRRGRAAPPPAPSSRALLPPPPAPPLFRILIW